MSSPNWMPCTHTTASDLRPSYATLSKRPRQSETDSIYGTGSELVDAVATVLTAAGLTVSDLDELLGDTSSADLLVSIGSNRRLVEVKSAGGNAGEKLVVALDRHLQTWPADPSERAG